MNSANTLSLFPPGFMGVSRKISPQALDKVYVKGFGKPVYVVPGHILRAEQRYWALSKIGEPTFHDAWNLALEAKSWIDGYATRLPKRKRKPTWRELWTVDELVYLRFLALHWILVNFSESEDVECSKIFLINDFMSKGMSELEERVWFLCPDGSIPGIEIKYKSSIQTSGALWIDESWEEAEERQIAKNTSYTHQKEEIEVIKRLWRFIPEDTYQHALLVKEPPSNVANNENLADIDEVAKREESLQYVISGRAVKRNNTSSDSD
jgi:hypothetical protein